MRTHLLITLLTFTLVTTLDYVGGQSLDASSMMNRARKAGVEPTDDVNNRNLNQEVDDAIKKVVGDLSKVKREANLLKRSWPSKTWKKAKKIYKAYQVGKAIVTVASAAGK